MKLLNWLWGLLPDKCSVHGCNRKGVAGNENRVPVDKHRYVLMCNECCAANFHYLVEEIEEEEEEIPIYNLTM